MKNQESKIFLCILFFLSLHIIYNLRCTRKNKATLWKRDSSKTESIARHRFHDQQPFQKFTPLSPLDGLNIAHLFPSYHPSKLQPSFGIHFNAHLPFEDCISTHKLIEQPKCFFFVYFQRHSYHAHSLSTTFSLDGWSKYTLQKRLPLSFKLKYFNFLNSRMDCFVRTLLYTIFKP